MKKKIFQILQTLGLQSKAKEGKLTNEDWNNIAESYQKTFNSDFYADMANDADNARKAEAHDKALELLADATETETTADEDQEDVTAEGAEGSEGAEAGKTKKPDLTAQVTKLADENKNLKSEVSNLKVTVNKLSGQATDDDSKEVTMKVGLIGVAHSKSHAFGIEHDMYSVKKRWNNILVNGGRPEGMSEPSDEEYEVFQKEVRSYGTSIFNRMQTLHRQGHLNSQSLNPKSDVVTYTDLSDAGLGDQYVVRRQDALIARIIELPTVKDLFPVRYGVQDQELITNAFFGEFSQAFQAGEVFKGTVSLQPEKGYVDDAMLKTQFESLKWIERQYIGYLNSNGSEPIKWNMIEWMMLNIATKLVKEQNERNILGIFRKPITGTAGHYLHAANGVLYSLIRYHHECKVKLFDAAGFATYDSTTILTVVENFVEEVKKYLPSVKGMAIYLNANHKKWYAAKYRSTYGTDGDFSGVSLDKLIDDDVEIKWVPNMGQLKFIWMTTPGNIQTLEFQPGEMFKVSFEQRMHTVLAWSVWKEGASAAFVGKRFDSIADLNTNNYADQVLFMNKPATTLADDAVTCDGTANFWFVSQANTTADKVITDITGAANGKGYIMEIGSATNPQKVTKANKFSEITADWTPTTVGDYLMVVYDEGTSKFYELERRVAGTRSVNSDVSPNQPS